MSERGEFVVLGDLFDTTRPTPQVIAATDRVFHSALPFRLLLGNHDMVSSERGDNALSVFWRGDRVVESTFVDPYNLAIYVPFKTGDARAWLPEAVAKGDKLLAEAAPIISSVPPAHRTLFIHLGVADDQTAEYLRESHDAVHVNLLRKLCAQYGIMAVFAGNWHTHRYWGPLKNQSPEAPLIMQVGALVPTGWDNPGSSGYGTVVQYNPQMLACEVKFLEGPRFYKIPFGKPVEVSGISYVQIVAPPDKVAEAQAQIEAWKKDGAVCDGFVTVDGAEARAAARAAAGTARSAKTLDEALAGYVKNIQIPEGCSAEQVLATTRRYLGSV